MKAVQFRSKHYQAVGLLEGDRVLDFTRGYLMYCAAADVAPGPPPHSIPAL